MCTQEQGQPSSPFHYSGDTKKVELCNFESLRAAYNLEGRMLA